MVVEVPDPIAPDEAGEASPQAGPPPRISVVMAVWNAAGTLQTALDSIFEQTFEDLELVVIDGASTDGTQAVLERNDDRIAYWQSEPDRGLYDAWNKGLDHVTGAWVCFLGADDRYHSPDVMEQVATLLAADEADGTEGAARRIAYGRLRKVWSDGRAWESRITPWNKRRRRAFRRGKMIPHPATFHRRALFDEIGRFDEGFRIAGDYDLVLRALTGSKPLGMEVLVVDMAAGGMSDRPENRVKVLREVYRVRRKNGIVKLPAWASPHHQLALLRTWWRWQGRPRLTRRPPT